MIKQHLTLFSTAIQQRETYIRGVLITGFFCLLVDEPITGAYKQTGSGGWGGGGSFLRECFVLE